MLSIEECRQELGDDGDDMTDEDIIQLRDAMYQFIEPIVDSCFEQKFVTVDKNT